MSTEFMFKNVDSQGTLGVKPIYTHYTSRCESMRANLRRIRKDLQSKKLEIEQLFLRFWSIRSFQLLAICPS